VKDYYEKDIKGLIDNKGQNILDILSFVYFENGTKIVTGEENSNLCIWEIKESIEKQTEIK
jgi:hypothetical protein